MKKGDKKKIKWEKEEDEKKGSRRRMKGRVG